jgi:hypothetical protein
VFCCYDKQILFPQSATSQKLQCTQLTPKTASVVPPEDGRLTPETCRESRHNKVIVKMKMYYVGYVIVIHNDTRSTERQISQTLVFNRQADRANFTFSQYKPKFSAFDLF